MGQHTVLNAEILSSFQPLDETALDSLLREELAKRRVKIVALDDDPTGTQTVHGVSVYTDWMADSVRKGFEEANRLFYILTNSRGFTSEQTIAAHKEIARTVRKVSQETQTPYLLISRSDSTLRGHYPLETETLRRTLEAEGEDALDGEILCFAFPEGGRFTMDNIHYMQSGSDLIPVGETEFAGDKTFSFRSSDLRDYVEEKTQGAFLAKDVATISLDRLRRMDFDGMEAILRAASGFSKIVVNAVDYCDIKAFCIAMYRAMGKSKGKQFLIRSATSLVKVAGGIGNRPLLSGAELVNPGNPHGGIVVIGSHVKKTTRQLEVLQQRNVILEFVEFNQHLVLEEGGLEREAARVTEVVERCIQAGTTCVVYTRREKIDSGVDDADAELTIAVRISDALVSVIGNLRVRPSFLVAKGGITSSDVGTKALGVQCATVMGQMLPGVPVWKTGAESKFPELPYVIFPGNVGDDDALNRIVQALDSGRKNRFEEG